MFVSLFRRALMSVAAIACLGLAGCSSIDGATAKAIGVVTPYKMDIVQGNVVTREQFVQIKPGMTRAQVRDLLGTALLTSVFHANRWDYVFSLKSQSAKNQQRKVTIFFKNDVVERTEADELPSETEFVSTLKSWVKPGQVTNLEASEETLKKFPAPAKPAVDSVVANPAPVNYPPLEPSSK